MRVFLLFISLFLTFSFSFAAEEAPEKEKTFREKAEDVLKKTEEVLIEAKDKVSEELSNSQTRRASSEYFALLNYSPLDLLVPSKYGATFGIVKSAKETWELEYLRGSLSFALLVDDLGSMTDQRLSLTRRSFVSRTFYIGYGATYFNFEAHLGADLLNSVGANIPSVDIVEVESLGAHVAIGSQWVFQNDITFSVEWAAWSQPIFQLRRDAPFLDHSNSESARDTVRKTLNVVSYFPHLSVLKVQFGMFF